MHENFSAKFTQPKMGNFSIYRGLNIQLMRKAMNNTKNSSIISRRDFIKKTTSTALVLAVGPYLTGCGSSDDGTDNTTEDNTSQVFSGTHFAVISDPHVYDTSLGTYGNAWQEYLLSDRKLLAESEFILASAVDRILEASPRPEFVIVAGDLTKDGEKQCHELFISYMNRLIENGIKVLVVPGNHDINNPHAKAFDSETPTAIDSISPEEFEEMYSAMGFADAIEKDPHSLSYISEPVPGLWVFCLDSCKYENNYEDDYPETSGEFSTETLDWIVENIETARSKNKLIVGTMHHGVVEHFTGQSVLPGLGDEYVVDNWEEVSETFANEGLNLVFTGHYHAQDAVERTLDSSYIFDVETGSLVTHPNPIRYVAMGTDNEAVITSEFVDEIDYDTNGETFTAYAYNFLFTGLTMQTPSYAMGFGIAQEKAEEMTPYLVRGMMAHYAGDESPTEEDLTAAQTYMQDSDPIIAMVGSVLNSLWSELPPSDTSPILNLDDGTVTA
jgi:hypothetical protein